LHWRAANYHTLRTFRLLLGLDGETGLARVIAVYLLGGSVSAGAEDSLLIAYQLGYGGIKLQTPGFEEAHYTPLAQFLQHVAPIYVSSLSADLYEEDFQMESDTASSFDEEELPSPVFDEIVPPIEAPN
jgi:hypothetical protein